MLASDAALSAAAAVELDTMLGKVTIDGCQARASALTSVVPEMLAKGVDAATLTRCIDTIEATLSEASPAERQEMAAALQNLLFVGQQARFTCDVAHERRLWTAIRNAPLTPADAKSA